MALQQMCIRDSTYCTHSTTGKDGEDDLYTVTKAYPADTKYYVVNTAGNVVKTKTKAKDGDDFKLNIKNKAIESILVEN